jgi:hypothetical protein
VKLEDAIVLAATAHAGQSDRSGEPYIRHCLRVMERLAPDVEAMVVGVLHDVQEDTDVEIGSDDLTYTQFHALRLLTRRRDDYGGYEDYILRLIEPGPAGTLAARVKLADLEDNLARNHRLREPRRSMLRARYDAARRACASRLGPDPGPYATPPSVSQESQA